MIWIAAGAKSSQSNFLKATNLATGMILEAAYVDENIEKVDLTKGTQKTAGLVLVTIKKSIGHAAYVSNYVKTRNAWQENEYKKHLVTADFASNILPRSKTGLCVKRNAKGVQVPTLQKSLFRKYQTFWA